MCLSEPGFWEITPISLYAWKRVTINMQSPVNPFNRSSQYDEDSDYNVLDEQIKKMLNYYIGDEKLYHKTYWGTVLDYKLNEPVDGGNFGIFIYDALKSAVRELSEDQVIIFVTIPAGTAIRRSKDSRNNFFCAKQVIPLSVVGYSQIKETLREIDKEDREFDEANNY